jgi:hypothetical protein
MSHITEHPTLTHRGTAASDGFLDTKSPVYEEKGAAFVEHVPVDETDMKETALHTDVGDVSQDVRAIDLGADGKERPIETASDYALRLLSLEDDTTLPVFTFRMWFLGLGLSCFGAVLGQLFYFRPQTISVSQLFLQVRLLSDSYVSSMDTDKAIRSSATSSVACLSASFPARESRVWFGRRTLLSGGS